MHPTVETVDATGPLPAHDGQFDRILAAVAVRSIPASWLTVLSHAGRPVITIVGTSLLVTANRPPTAERWAGWRGSGPGSCSLPRTTRTGSR
ncbi:hypothetical protein AB0K68_42030 [Streptomyces sp. NPDC050698]